MNNSFQKNPFVSSSNNNQYNNGKFSNYAKLGRKTVEQVQEEMNNLKYKNFENKTFERKTEVNNQNDFNHSTDFRNRVNNLRNINRD